MMDNRIREICRRCLENNASQQDREELHSFFSKAENKELLMELIQTSLEQKRNELSIEKETLDNIVSAILQADQSSSRIDTPVYRIRFLRKWGWAAASFIVICLCIYLFVNKNEENAPETFVAVPADIQAGQNGAILTLADGKQIVLDSATNGLVANQFGSEIVLRDGSLVYESRGRRNDEIVYNTMSTPRGRQFTLILPDGSRVWLNSESSITFPTVFTGDVRQVKVKGEVYIEVEKNAKMPFKLQARNGLTVDVLGTQFNIKAYENENAITTTLVQGCILVNSNKLIPGQQAKLEQGVVNVLNDVDIEKVMAWKNGLFNFEGSSLSEVMKELERWYNIDVTYEGPLPDIKFGGKMTRDIPLSGLMIMLEKFKVNCTLNGRNLKVSAR